MNSKTRKKRTQLRTRWKADEKAQIARQKDWLENNPYVGPRVFSEHVLSSRHITGTDVPGWCEDTDSAGVKLSPAWKIPAAQPEKKAKAKSPKDPDKIGRKTVMGATAPGKYTNFLRVQANKIVDQVFSLAAEEEDKKIRAKREAEAAKKLKAKKI